ncbi:MAG: ribonuclease D [Alphaproteobacteria bacterium]|nr:ribonuclease D [Alphaproteobacteria bacterium]
MSITLHKEDLPDGISFGDSVAVDTETMGLNPLRDRLCLVQLSAGDGSAHLVQFGGGSYKAPNLCALLSDPKVVKIFHFARFDVATLKHHLGVDCRPVYCTKIASKLARTYTDDHSLRGVCRDLLGVEISKQQQSSDWGSGELTNDQLSYAANDVYYLHKLRAQLEAKLKREGRAELAQKCFDFLSTRADLDLAGWPTDIFEH